MTTSCMHANVRMSVCHALIWNTIASVCIWAKPVARVTTTSVRSNGVGTNLTTAISIVMAFINIYNK